MKLVLVRHGESVWNKENLFTGWMDVKLSDRGENEAAEAGKLLKDSGFEFDICYTSMLKRAIKTLNLILEQMDYDWLPVLKDWRLNERHYGALQGLNKIETAKKYGEDQVKIWRRSYDVRPPELNSSDAMYTDMLKRYRNLENPPLAESLKDTVARVIPYFESDIKPKMLSGENLLIAAHGNSLRALVKYFENLTDDAISEVNIPTGIPLVYEFDENFAVLKKYYLGDSDAAEKKAQAVANQMKEER